MRTESLPADLAALSLNRQTLVVIPPHVEPQGALLLFTAKRADLVKGDKLIPGTWWAATWSKFPGIPGRLDLVNPTTWRVPHGGSRSMELPPVDLREPVRRRPQPVLEALALAARFELEIEITYQGKGRVRRETRRLRAIKLNAGRQLVVAHDLDRDAPRSFSLSGISAVTLAQGQRAPQWRDGLGYFPGGAP